MIKVRYQWTVFSSILHLKIRKKLNKKNDTILDAIQSLHKKIKEMKKIRSKINKRTKLKLDYDGYVRKLSRLKISRSVETTRIDRKQKNLLKSRERLEKITDEIYKEFSSYEAKRKTMISSELRLVCQNQLSFFQHMSKKFSLILQIDRDNSRNYSDNIQFKANHIVTQVKSKNNLNEIRSHNHDHIETNSNKIDACVTSDFDRRELPPALRFEAPLPKGFCKISKIDGLKPYHSDFSAIIYSRKNEGQGFPVLNKNTQVNTSKADKEFSSVDYLSHLSKINDQNKRMIFCSNQDISQDDNQRKCHDKLSSIGNNQDNNTKLEPQEDSVRIERESTCSSSIPMENDDEKHTNTVKSCLNGDHSLVPEEFPVNQMVLLPLERIAEENEELFLEDKMD